MKWSLCKLQLNDGSDCDCLPVISQKTSGAEGKLLMCLILQGNTWHSDGHLITQWQDDTEEDDDDVDDRNEEDEVLRDL